MLKYIHKNKCGNYFLDLYNNSRVIKIINIKPFDVTLRLVLQNLTYDKQQIYTTNFKKQIYQEILEKYEPENIEIGSCVDKKINSILKDTEELFNSINDNNNKYILVSNQEQLINAIKFGATNFSFITSVSNSFQFKNTELTKQENLQNLNNMLGFLHDYSSCKFDLKNGNVNKNYKKFNVKLYVSCINECPLEGKYSNLNIANELYSLICNNFNNLDKICLSDTCGTLTNTEFNAIIDMLYEMGIDINKITLDLRINQDREDEVEKIFHSAIDYGINEFDVSDLKISGSPITIDKNKLALNMSYEQFYKFINNYLLK